MDSGYMDYDPAFFTDLELKQFGFYQIGKNVKISSKCSFYSIRGSIGDNVRIDDFCILKGEVDIGSNVHICSFSMVSGAQARVYLSHFCVLAARCSIYTGSNNHSATALPAPLAPEAYSSQIIGPVHVGVGVMVGAHVVILPNTWIGDGAGIGAGCVVSGQVAEGSMLRSARPTTLTNKRNVQAIRKMIARYFEITRAGV